MLAELPTSFKACVVGVPHLRLEVELRGVINRHERIQINPKVMLGEPVIKGSRITVKLDPAQDRGRRRRAYITGSVFAPHQEDIQAAVRYAADRLAHEEVLLAATQSLS